MCSATQVGALRKTRSICDELKRAEIQNVPEELSSDLSQQAIMGSMW